jgi:hypothetical protein
MRSLALRQLQRGPSEAVWHHPDDLIDRAVELPGQDVTPLPHPGDRSVVVGPSQMPEMSTFAAREMSATGCNSQLPVTARGFMGYRAPVTKAGGDDAGVSSLPHERRSH